MRLASQKHREMLRSTAIRCRCLYNGSVLILLEDDSIQVASDKVAKHDTHIYA